MSKKNTQGSAELAATLSELTKNINKTLDTEAQIHYCAASCEDEFIDMDDLGLKYLDEASKNWDPNRIRDFLLGRYCSETVLKEMGSPKRIRAGSEEKIPVWPKATVGSISHSKGFAAAVSARWVDIVEIGIDIEFMREVESVRKIAERALSKAEIKLLERDSRGMLCAVSAKEAAYKMIYPAYGKTISFDDFQIFEKFDASRQFGKFKLKIMRDELIEFTTLSHIEMFYCATDEIFQNICIKKNPIDY